MPMPAITACLMVSVLRDLHRDLDVARCARRSPPPSTCQVSEPFSRTTNGSRISVAMLIRFLPTSGCDRRGDDDVGMRRERLG